VLLLSWGKQHFAGIALGAAGRSFDQGRRGSSFFLPVFGVLLKFCLPLVLASGLRAGLAALGPSTQDKAGNGLALGGSNGTLQGVRLALLVHFRLAPSARPRGILKKSRFFYQKGKICLQSIPKTSNTDLAGRKRLNVPSAKPSRQSEAPRNLPRGACRQQPPSTGSPAGAGALLTTNSPASGGKENTP
jgi:hypothetical protein